VRQTKDHGRCMISKVKIWMLKKIEEVKRREAKGRFVEKRFVERKEV
jgi:hypothetical protein